MGFKFEKLEVWDLALQYIDLAYGVASRLPQSEDYNLKSQIIRAATSVALNIAEGSTSQSDVEQSRFIKMAIRSLVESMACMHIIKRRGYANNESLSEFSSFAERLFAKLQAFRNSLDMKTSSCTSRHSIVGGHDE
ncbi:MAG: four helix bundle protein [Actinomycetota bacterium]|nr:four helix bundle protein [Actinomycetota bacterium]